MCGIAGELRWSGADGIEDPAAWRDRMRRRGPDAGGLFSDDRVTLTFRRLAILDLTADGDQPMATPDGDGLLLWNGELYNFRQLRAELEAIGRVFRSTGDTEVVLQALCEWGPEALERFDAMFALAFYDRRRGRLMLARDGLGIKPLYVAESRHGVVFASQYDLVSSHPWCRDASIDPQALGLFLRLGHIPAPHAILSGTRMLEPGRWLEIDGDGNRREATFWSFPRDREPDLSGDAAMAAVAEVVERSVDRQLISDVPLGTFLSGGIDSPLVTAVLACIADHPAFTLATADETDESADAIAYATELAMEHVVEPLPTDRRSIDALFEQAVESVAEPFNLKVMIPQLVISRRAAEDVRVVLSGDGGDELFWGYVGRFGSVLHRAPAFGQPLALRRARWWWKRLTGLGDGEANLCFPDIGHWVRAKHTKAHGVEGLLVDPPPWPQTYDRFDFDGHNVETTARWLRWNELVAHLPYVLLKVDRASMHHSLETRVPLLGRDVVEVASRVDWRSCLDLQSGLGKLPLRHALEQRVQHASRIKRGFDFSGAAWLRGPLRDRLRDTLLGRRDLLGMPLRKTAVEPLVDTVLEGRHSARNDPSPTLWCLLSLAAWEDRWRPEASN